MRLACIAGYTMTTSRAGRAFADWFTYILSDEYASLTVEEHEAA